MKPIPNPVYPCHYCNEDYSWPSQDLNWCESLKSWVCINCWTEGLHGKPGITLEQEIKNQKEIHQ